MGGDDWPKGAVLYEVRPGFSADPDGNGIEDPRAVIAPLGRIASACRWAHVDEEFRVQRGVAPVTGLDADRCTWRGTTAGSPPARRNPPPGSTGARTRDAAPHRSRTSWQQVPVDDCDDGVLVLVALESRNSHAEQIGH
jgi:hypothetical protein